MQLRGMLLTSISVDKTLSAFKGLTVTPNDALSSHGAITIEMWLLLVKIHNTLL